VSELTEAFGERLLVARFNYHHHPGDACRPGGHPSNADHPAGVWSASTAAGDASTARGGGRPDYR
jgi:hypothetical protein